MDVAADYYATLGVEPRADAAAIRRAYRKLMRSYHPDVNASDDAEAKAKAINEAYACLYDPTKRAAYDGRQQARRNARRDPASRRPPASPFTPRPFHPTWGTLNVDTINRESVVPKRWRLIALGLAAVVTVITFTMTSSVDTTGAPPALPTVTR